MRKLLYADSGHTHINNIELDRISGIQTDADANGNKVTEKP